MTSLATVKRYLRIEGSGEDALLTSLSLAGNQYLLNAGVKPPTAPTGLPYATAQFGEGEHGVVTVTAPVAGIAGDSYSLEVVQGEGELTVDLEDKKLTITLADGGSLASEIAEAITGLGGLTATASGEGSGVVTEVLEATHFSGGATVEEAAYLQELELYDLAVTLYVNMLYNGADDKSLEAAMTSIILQIKD